ncbi:MAG: flagellar hook assembly protein FlgD [Bdellovibrionales bacterium]
MIDTRTTQSFRNKPGEQVSAQKSDATNYMGANDLKRLKNGNVGDELNKIVDPNWVDPAKLRKVGNENLDKDAFLKLMLTQMKHQDPTTPLESHEMASQLAQFTSLEQMQNMNTNIENLVKANKPNSQFQALQFIGKSIESDSSKIFRGKGDKGHEVRFDLMQDAAEINVKIKDADGDLVREYSIADLKKGRNSIDWNGYNNQDQKTREGEYYAEITAKDGNGKGIVATTTVAGKITGVNYTQSGPVLLVGTQTVSMSEVRKIVDENIAQSKSRDVKDVTDKALKVEAKKEDTDTKAEGVATEAARSGNISKVPMAKNLYDKVK